MQKDIIVMDYDVGDVNADAKLYPFVQRYGRVFLDHAALDFKGAQPSADYGDRQPPAAAIIVRARKRFNPRSGSSAMMAQSSNISLIAAAIFGISRMLLTRNDVAGSATTARSTARPIVDRQRGVRLG